MTHYAKYMLISLMTLTSMYSWAWCQGFYSTTTIRPIYVQFNTKKFVLYYTKIVMAHILPFNPPSPTPTHPLTQGFLWGPVLLMCSGSLVGYCSYHTILVGYQMRNSNSLWGNMFSHRPTSSMRYFFVPVKQHIWMFQTLWGPI